MIIWGLLLGSADPMRSIDQVITSGQSLADLQGCVTRVLATNANVIPTPSENGVALDVYERRSVLGGNQARISFVIRDGGDHRSMTVEYRHPANASFARSFLKQAGKKCFPDDLSQAELPPNAPAPR